VLSSGCVRPQSFYYDIPVPREIHLRRLSWARLIVNRCQRLPLFNDRPQRWQFVTSILIMHAACNAAPFMAGCWPTMQRRQGRRQCCVHAHPAKPGWARAAGSRAEQASQQYAGSSSNGQPPNASVSKAAPSSGRGAAPATNQVARLEGRFSYKMLKAQPVRACPHSPPGATQLLIQCACDRALSPGGCGRALVPARQPWPVRCHPAFAHPSSLFEPSLSQVEVLSNELRIRRLPCWGRKDQLASREPLPCLASRLPPTQTLTHQASPGSRCLA
jgi:hypothetical protein